MDTKIDKRSRPASVSPTGRRRRPEFDGPQAYGSTAWLDDFALLDRIPITPIVLSGGEMSSVSDEAIDSLVEKLVAATRR